MQRLLAARSQRQSAAALLSSGAAILFQFGLFLFLGVMLFAYYMLPSAHFGKADRIYPTFIVTRMPHGISGLLIAAILAAAMSNLSAALNSLSSSTILDFYVRLRPQTAEDKKMRLSRLSTVGLGNVTVPTGGAFVAPCRTCDRGGPADCINRLWIIAGSIFAGSANRARKSERGNYSECSAASRPKSIFGNSRQCRGRGGWRLVPWLRFVWDMPRARS